MLSIYKLNIMIKASFRPSISFIVDALEWVWNPSWSVNSSITTDTWCEWYRYKTMKFFQGIMQTLTLTLPLMLGVNRPWGVCDLTKITLRSNLFCDVTGILRIKSFKLQINALTLECVLFCIVKLWICQPRKI